MVPRVASSGRGLPFTRTSRPKPEGDEAFAAPAARRRAVRTWWRIGVSFRTIGPVRGGSVLGDAQGGGSASFRNDPTSFRSFAISPVWMYIMWPASYSFAVIRARWPGSSPRWASVYCVAKYGVARSKWPDATKSFMSGVFATRWRSDSLVSAKPLWAPQSHRPMPPPRMWYVASDL